MKGPYGWPSDMRGNLRDIKNISRTTSGKILNSGAFQVQPRMNVMAPALGKFTPGEYLLRRTR
jgi:hypothetical protein